MQHLCHTLDDGGFLVYSWFEAMHTRMDIILWDKEISGLEQVSESILEEIQRIEAMGSCFLSDSEISAINASPVGVPVKVSDELFQLLERCLDYNICKSIHESLSAGR